MWEHEVCTYRDTHLGHIFRASSQPASWRSNWSTGGGTYHNQQLVKDFNLTIGLGVHTTKSTTNWPRIYDLYQIQTYRILILLFNQDVLHMDLPTCICQNTQPTQKKCNVLVYETLHESNKTRKCPICCILFTIIHEINYIDKFFICSIVIVFRHWFTHSIQKLALLEWPNTWNKLIEQSIVNLGWYHGQNCNNWRTVFYRCSQNMHNNPLFNKYLTVFKQPHNNTSMCILTPERISNIIQPNNTPTTSFPTISVPSAIYDLTMFFNTRDTAQHNKHNDLIGDIHRRGASKIGILIEPIAFRSDTMNIEKYGLALETALFPHGHGVYDGRVTLLEYLKYRMETLFSPFTLYKPYLLYMYDVRQCCNC